MANFRTPDASAMGQALAQLYSPIRTTGQREITRQGDIATRKALEDFSARGAYSSGGATRAIAEGVGANTASALGALESNIASTLGQQTGNIYQQAMSQMFQEDAMRQQRQWSEQDYLRDTMMNLASIFVNPIASGIGTNIGYNMAPNVYQQALSQLSNPFPAGRGTMQYLSTGTQPVQYAPARVQAPGGLPGIGG